MLTGRFERSAFIDGKNTNYEYNAIGDLRLQPNDMLTAVNDALSSVNSYSYDKTGNRTSLTEPKPEGGPALALSQLGVYWASYADWLNHLLSVDYRITNSGPGTAYTARVTNASATNGVYLTTQMPLGLGDIPQAGNSPFTLKYYIPTGVTSFSTTVYSTCQDAGDTDYYYPDKKSFYSYNKANQLTTLSDYQGATTAFSYDANGALSQKVKGSDTTSYAYNGLDRLTEVVTPSLRNTLVRTDFLPI